MASGSVKETTKCVENHDEHEGSYFRDGLRRIDMVLVHDRNVPQFNQRIRKTKCRKKRDKYIEELQSNGLEVEMDVLNDEKNVPTYFLKLHATSDTLKKKAEEMRLRLPVANQDFDSDSRASRRGFLLVGPSSYQRLDPANIHKPIVPRNQNYILAPFSLDHVDKFVGHGECFDTIDRIRIVQRILDETHFSKEKRDVGIKTLLYQKVFKEAYPLHDGPSRIDDRHPQNARQRLWTAWATFRKFFKNQPIDEIKSYFGAAIGVYFSWLGFCVQMLLPAALVGILVLAYGILHSSAGNYPPVNEICNHGNSSKFVMCPQCDKKCWYWYLSDMCTTAKVTAWFDNDLTVLFGIFMSIWSTLLTELWKRRQAKLAFEWQTYNIREDEEASRADFVATVSTIRRHIVTGKPEQYIPTVTMCKRYTVVLSVFAFMLTLALAAVIAVVAYRGAVYAVLITSGHLGFGGEMRIITDVTAGLLNLVAINAMSFVYRRVAQVLTDWENPRTQSGWEKSFTYKMFAYHFVNVYSSVFYIAFFKSGLMIGTPGHFHRFGTGHGKHGFRLESCPPSGCLLELCIQLLVIMVGQQLLQNITEMLKPFVTMWRNTRRRKLHLDTLVQWQQDYCLAAVDDILFWEYLEIVLQLGFVMMFSVAFPLAPLFAFINCLLEIRLDAIKLVFSQKRPCPKMFAGIGAWQLILEHLSEFSVLVNAFVIGFTTEFIPKLVYRLSYSPDGTLNGYVNNSLSFYNTSFFPKFERPDISFVKDSEINYEPKFCRYRGYHELGRNQEHSLQFWHVMAVRFVFILAFNYTICCVKKILEWMIPDEKEEIKLRRIKTVCVIKELFKEIEEKLDTVHAA